jgi:hypothetical protein
MNMMGTRILVISAALAACLATVGAEAQTREMYQYTDENGTVVFTDKKPANVDAQKHTIPAESPPQGDNPYADLVEQNEPTAAQQRREAITSDRKQRREEQAQLEAQCAAWQADVDRLEPHRRQFYTDESGETVRMDDEERVKLVAELKQKIADNCN